MAASAYQSLYRRYRPQRFDEVLGQDHVTKALRNAVRDGRVGHAYLFSGPRGTGKTSTARILAKVLNCAAPEDGEPCGKCDNCLAVERGQVTDWLLEQDAASKSKVDDMRDLLDRVPLGTSGNRKVIILDEVHMLSQGAENALLKTLEEPPDHVVFVLATTDPQKVRPTIRSRTQHFGFHLLPPDVLAEHVRHVIADASLSLADDAVAHVVQAGGGSARDTLSALDQVAALGEVVSDTQPVDAILDAVADRNAGAVLLGVADAMSTGRDPRALGEAIIGRLRDAFLALMGAAGQLPEAERARAQALGERMGAAGLTRALDVLGEALTELSRKPDPRIVVEVALIRLVRPEADRSIDAVLDRLERLENAVASGALPVVSGGEGPDAVASETAPTAPQTAAPSSDRAPTGRKGPGGPAAGARAALAAQVGDAGGGGKKPSLQPSTASTPPAPAPSQVDPSTTAPSQEESPAPASPPAEASPSADAPANSGSPSTDAPATATSAGGPDLAAMVGVWNTLLPELPINVRSKWRGGSWVDAPAGRLRFEVPNEWHKKACDDGRLEVEKVLKAHFGQDVAVEVSIAGTTAPADPSQPGDPPAVEPDDDHEALEGVDIAELSDAGDVATGGVELLMREFGGELVEEDPR